MLSKCIICSDLTKEQKKFSNLMEAFHKSLADNELKEELEEYYEEIKSEWAQLAKIFDVIFAVTFSSFTFFIMMLFFFYVNH